MKSISHWQFTIFASALLLTVNLLTGCDVSSSSKVAGKEDSAQKEDAAKTEVDQAAPAQRSTEDKSLTIGSTAPPLDIKHWLSDGHGKFDKVTSFESGKVYVVEFWATWCGPCVRSMPHLAELQETFADQGVQIISVSDEDVSTVEGLLERKYKSPEEDGPSTYGELTGAYCLTTDPDQSVKEDYMRAAGQTGIPCAFVVGKSGLIEWIGHPNGMEKVLQQVVDDSWDREEAAIAIRKTNALKEAMLKVMRLARAGKIDEARATLAEEKENLDADLAPAIEQLGLRLDIASVDQMIKADQIEDAVAEIQRLRENASGPLTAMWDRKLVDVLLRQKRYEEATDAVNNLVNDLPAQALNQMAWEIYEHASDEGEIPPQLLNAAISAAKKGLEESPDHGAILDTLAHLLHLSGDLDGAIEAQTKALLDPGPSESELKKFLEQLIEEKEKAEVS